MDQTITLMHLNRLIRINEDSKEGYRQAAEAVDISGFETIFLKIAQDRARFAEELRGEVIRMGEEPVGEGSMMGPLHRAWINLRAAVSSRDTYAVLEECRRGDDAAIDEYEAVLETDLPQPLKELIGRQLEEIHETRREVKAYAEARE